MYTTPSRPSQPPQHPAELTVGTHTPAAAAAPPERRVRPAERPDDPVPAVRPEDDAPRGEPWLWVTFSAFVPATAAAFAPQALRIPLLVGAGALLAGGLVMLGMQERRKRQMHGA